LEEKLKHIKRASSNILYKYVDIKFIVHEAFPLSLEYFGGSVELKRNTNAFGNPVYLWKVEDNIEGKNRMQVGTKY
jgi:hypothetical protein